MVNCNKDFLRNRRALVGFDGYIDRILRPIAQTTEETAAYFDTIGDFGNFLAGKTGKSCAIQLDCPSIRIRSAIRAMYSLFVGLTAPEAAL